jgi:hypothetical protein
MAVDYSADAKQAGGSRTFRVAMDAAAGNVVAVTLPRWVRSLTITLRENDTTTATTGAFAFSGTDGAAQIATAFPVEASGAYDRKIAGRGRPAEAPVVYLSCGANNGFAYLDCEG